MTEEERISLDPHSLEYHLRTKGSQTQLFGWLVYTCLLWVLKTCWLFFYKRLGEGVDRMPLKINIGFVFVGVSFLATFGTILLKCQPISKNWQIYPDPGNWCQPAVSRLQAYVLITTNLATDLYIMSIPVPVRPPQPTPTSYAIIHSNMSRWCGLPAFHPSKNLL